MGLSSTSILRIVVGLLLIVGIILIIGWQVGGWFTKGAGSTSARPGSTSSRPGSTSARPGSTSSESEGGIAVPESLSSEEESAIEEYCKGNYPLLSEYNSDFWKSLDFFWDMACYTSYGELTAGGLSYIPKAKTSEGSVTFRYIVEAFDKAAGDPRWLTFSPSLSSITDENRAGFTYEENGPAYDMNTASLPVYGIYLLPLCSFLRSLHYINAIMVNRYPQGHDRVNAHSYAVSGTGNSTLSSNVIPGVDKIHLNKGFKSGAMIEVSHCDPHMKNLPTDVNCIGSCDFLATQCTGSPPPSIGFGKWLYYTRGSGIWFNLGETTVFQNKVDSIMQSINLWDGKDHRDGEFVSDDYKGTLQGKFSDSSDLDTWISFVEDSDGSVIKALTSILTGSCLTSGSTKPSTAKIDILDNNQSGSCSDFLNLGDADLYSGPCEAQPKYCDINSSNNILPLWWFWSPNVSSQMGWGSLSPLVPNSMTTDAQKLGWLLWASVNGYDFSGNPNKYEWSEAVTAKYATKEGSIIANNYLRNMGNSGFSTDDVLIGFANYARKDSIQLTTSGVVGNLTAFEILTFTGTIDKNQVNDSGWICDSVNPEANMPCKTVDTNRETEWLGGSESTFMNADPIDISNTVSCIPQLSDCDDMYYLKCDEVNYSDSGYAYPMTADNKDIILSCQS